MGEEPQNLAADLAGMLAIHAISTRLIGAGDLHALLREILEAAARLTRTDKGNIQFFEPRTQKLRIVVHQGLGERFIERFTDGGCNAAAGAALRARQRVLIEDVTREPQLRGTEDLETLLGDDIRAIQCTPLVSRGGRILGMLINHFRAPHTPSGQDLRFLDLLARMAADLIERSLAEDALRDSEERYRSLFESIDDGLCVIEVLSADAGAADDFRIVECNPAFAGLARLAYGADRPAARRVPDIDPTWIAACRDVARSGEPVRFEHHALAANSWFEVNAFRFGKPTNRNVAVLFRDITQRKADETRDRFMLRLSDVLRPLADPRAVMAQATRVLARHLSANRVVYVDFNADHTRAIAEESYTDGMEPLEPRHPLHGFDASLLDQLHVGRTYVNPDPADDPALSDAQKGAFARLGVRSAIVVPLLKAGRLAGVLAVHHATPRIWHESEVASVEATAQKTWHAVERARADSALRESEAKFHDLADNISQCAWMAERYGSIFWYNRRWFEYTGSTLEEARGSGWRKFIHPAHLEHALARMEQLLKAGAPWEDSFPIRAADGAYRWFLFRAMPIRDAQGRVVRWFGTGTDIDDQRVAEQALREADRRKDEFLAILGHELRTPLAPIRNAVHVLRKRGSADEQVNSAHEMIDRQVRQMVRLIEDLLDVSRISADKMRLRTERVELASVVNQAIEAVRADLDTAKHELTVQLPPGPVYLDADPSRLVQVFTNLLSNACKYTLNAGRIALAVRCMRSPDGQPVATVHVKDNGIGMPAAFLPHLFECFSQAEPALERAQGGLGIGLALVHRLVELHGGQISGHSDGPGLGSEFVVCLPMIAEAATDAQHRTDDDASRTDAPSRRALVVDDNRDNAESLAMLMRAYGDEVETAHDGFEALAIAERLRPDVVLLDLGMPKLNGYDTCRVLRTQTWGQDVIVIAQTGWGQTTDRQRTAQAGFDGHLVKPIEYAALVQLLASVATNRRRAPSEGNG